MRSISYLLSGRLERAVMLPSLVGGGLVRQCMDLGILALSEGQLYDMQSSHL